jgi:hypothetical protein
MPSWRSHVTWDDLFYASPKWRQAPNDVEAVGSSPPGYHFDLVVRQLAPAACKPDRPSKVEQAPRRAQWRLSRKRVCAA